MPRANSVYDTTSGVAKSDLIHDDEGQDSLLGDSALHSDADGTGAGARVPFATLGTWLAMTAPDFFVI